MTSVEHQKILYYPYYQDFPFHTEGFQLTEHY